MLIVVICVAGIALRCWFPSRLAVEHFDEGVYASNYFFDSPYRYHYPAQHLYAPPLLPILIEWIFIAFGPSNVGAMIPSLIAGCLTVPLVWWVGRSWFGPATGLAASALCAFSDPHIVFSRTALTDVLLCFWLLLAVYFQWQALTTGRRRSIVAAGLFTGLAWWTKYNGWLSLAICGAAIVPWWLQPMTKRTAGSVSDLTSSKTDHPQDQVTGIDLAARGAGFFGLLQLLVCWLMVAVIAFVIWSPWLWSLQAEGGYSAVAANHHGYLVGLAGWMDSAARQSSNLWQLDGFPSRHAPLAALVVTMTWLVAGDRRFTWNRLVGSFGTWLGLGLVLGLPVAIGGWVFAAILAVIGLVVTLAISPRKSQLADWIVCAWFVGLALTTPLYTAYPRLTLPWVMSSWFAGGLGLNLIATFLGQVAADKHSGVPGSFKVTFQRIGTAVPRGAIVLGAIAGGIAGVYALERFANREDQKALFPGFMDRTGIRESARGIAGTVRSDVLATSTFEPGRFVIFTMAEPALLFQLNLAGLDKVMPISSLSLAGSVFPHTVVPTYVVFGRQAWQTTDFERHRTSVSRRLVEIEDPDHGGRFLEQVGSPDGFSYAPSGVVLLDDPHSSTWNEPLMTGRVILGFEIHRVD